MIKLRLKRFGKKREVSYRVVAVNSTSRRDGRPLEELGFYNPRTDEIRLDVDGIQRRLSQGAQPTDTVRDLLRKQNILGVKQAGQSAGQSAAHQASLQAEQPVSAAAPAIEQAQA